MRCGAKHGQLGGYHTQAFLEPECLRTCPYRFEKYETLEYRYCNIRVEDLWHTFSEYDVEKAKKKEYMNRKKNYRKIIGWENTRERRHLESKTFIAEILKARDEEER